MIHIGRIVNSQSYPKPAHGWGEPHNPYPLIRLRGHPIVLDGGNKWGHHRSIVVEAPASIANLGPGFDILATAIEGFRDRVRISILPGDGRIHIRVYGYSVPVDERNVAYPIIRRIIDEYDLMDRDFLIDMYKGIPVSAGLGSSGATSAAIAYGFSTLLCLNLDKKGLLRLAGCGEKHVAGSPHYDNIAASLFGNIVIVDPHELDVHIIRPNVEYWFGLLIPVARGSRAKTMIARKIIPTKIDIGVHVKQSAVIARLVHALHVGDIEALGRAISLDYIAEPYRSSLIREYWMIKEIAMREGALGFNIAGAGPTLFILHRSRKHLLGIGRRLLKYLDTLNLGYSFHITRISRNGVRIVEA